MQTGTTETNSAQFWPVTYPDVAHPPPPLPTFGKQGQIGTKWTETNVFSQNLGNNRSNCQKQSWFASKQWLLPSSLRDKLASISDLVMMNILVNTEPFFFSNYQFHHVWTPVLVLILTGESTNSLFTRKIKVIFPHLIIMIIFGMKTYIIFIAYFP